MPAFRLRCPSCGERFDTLPEEDDYPVVLCPECDEPIDRLAAPSRGRTPTAVWTAALMAVVPPLMLLVLWMFVAARGGNPEPGFALLAVAGAVIGGVVGGGVVAGSSTARMLLFVWAVLCKIAGVVAFLIGIPLLCAWGVGLIIMAMSVPVIVYAFVLLMVVNRASVREWCRQRW